MSSKVSSNSSDTFLDLEFFSVDFIFNIVNSVVQFGDVHFTVFISGFSSLQSFHQLVDLVLQFFFSFSGLFGRDFELLHVFTNGFEFLFNILQLGFGQFGSFGGSLAFIFLDNPIFWSIHPIFVHCQKPSWWFLSNFCLLLQVRLHFSWSCFQST